MTREATDLHDDSIRIEPYRSDSGAEWNDAAAALGASLYHRYEWRRINQTALRHDSLYLSALQAGRIVGLLPLVSVHSRMFGRIVCSMPFVNFGGPYAATAAIEDQLVQTAMRYTEESGADYLELRCANSINTQLPASRHKISMTIELAADPDVLWREFTHKHRKNIRRAYKNGLAVTSGGVELLTSFYRMLSTSWRNLGTPLYSKRYFHAVLSALPDHTRIFLCHCNGAPVAAALTGYHGGVCEGLWAGGGTAARKLDANYVLYWEMIRDACVRGCRSFHLGRSTAHSGSEDFKSKWNAVPTQLYWYYGLPRGGETPALNVANPRYQLAIRTWRRTPLWFTRLVGPSLARNIP